MKKVLIALLTAGLITSGCQKSTESVPTKEVSQNVKQDEKKIMTNESNDISTSNLSGIAMYLKKTYRLEDLERTLSSPRTKEETRWLYVDNYAKYTFESDGKIINHIKIELLEPKDLKYKDAFKLLGLDIMLGTKIESEGTEAEGYAKYDVRGNDAESVQIEKFSGTGGGSISVSVDGAFKNKEGTVWLDCDRDGNVKFIEMNYKGKAVGNETSVANEKLEPFDAEAGSEVGKNIANIKVYDTKDLLIEQTGLALFLFQATLYDNPNMYYTADFPIKVRVDNKSTVEEAVKIGNEINNLVVSAVNKKFPHKNFRVKTYIYHTELDSSGNFNATTSKKLKIIEN
ncbi:hypothetical protein FHQ13_016115 [Bacillus cereus]|uniref:hypothetical protein n=1 Tax=Bacillus cereus TaxID=1396 RepID=UPI0011211ADC|nr:hypothetical protein [Bacillus cereus]UDV98804.1 hypothetical protein FHQ13_016115 [Bacillus cereus]